MIPVSPIVRRLPLHRQALLCAVLAWISMLFIRFTFHGTGSEYMAAFIGILFYSVMNSIVSVFHSDFMKYTLPGYAWYLGLTVVLLLSAKMLSGFSIWELSAYRSMILAITIFYGITSIAVRMIRAVYEFAETMN